MLPHGPVRARPSIAMNTRTARRAKPGWLTWRLVLAMSLAMAALAYVLPLAATRIIGQKVLRAHAQAALASALDHPVDIQGDVSLTMSPWFGLRTGPVTVANDPGFGPDPLLRAASVTIGLRLSSLALKKVVVNSIALASATLNLGRDEAGRENWRPVVRREQKLPKLLQGWKVESLPTGLRLWNAQLSYTDRRTGVSLDVRRLTLDTSQTRPFDFSVSCEVTVNPWGVTGEVNAQGAGSYGGKEGGHVFVHSSQASGWMQLPPSAGLPGGKVDFSGQVKVHGEAGAFEVAGMTLEGLGARITGQVNAGGLYEERPYLNLKLAATADRDGAWTRPLGLNLASPRAQTPPAVLAAPGREPEEPSLQPPPPPRNIEAELELAATPQGWLAKRVVLRDGRGRLEGSVKNIGGDLSFNIQAQGLDLTPWLTANALPAFSAGPGLKSVLGRFSGADLRAGPLDIQDMEVNARGEQGALRLYPFTARTRQALLTSDIRIKPGPETYVFSGSSRIQGLPDETAAEGPPLTMAEANLDGAANAEGISGSLRLTIADFTTSWKPLWLSENARKAWSILGGGSAQASFKLPSGKDFRWEMPDLAVKTGYSQVTGKASGGPDGASLDIQADRLDLDRLRQLAALFGDGGGYAPWPVEAKVTAKHFSAPVSAPGLDVNDLLVAMQASPEALKLSTFTGAALGGRFTGAMELDDRPGRKTVALSLAASAVQAAQLRAVLPEIPKMNGPLDCRLSLDGTTSAGVPVWQGLRGQADLQMGQGSVTFSSEQEGSQPWAVSRASASLKFATKPVQPQPGERPREAATADVTGSVRLDSPGVVRVTQVELKGQAGLDAKGSPLWYRQPRAEGVHTLNPPFAPGKTIRASWAGKFEADLEKGGFAFSGVELNLGGVPGRVSLSAQPGQAGPVLSGSVDVPDFTPREAAQRLGFSLPAGAAPGAWRRARFSADIGGGFREVRFSRIQAGLDDIVVTGEAAINGPKTRLDLSVSALDLDRLAPTPKYPDPAKRPEDPIPLSELRELAMEGKVHIARMVKDHLVWENVLTEFATQGGRFQVHQSAPSFYGGPYQLDLTGDARGPELKARMELRLAGFSAPQLLRDLAGAENLTKGMADFQVSVDTHGATDRALKRNAAGAASFEVRDGKIALKESAGRPQQQQTPQAGGLTIDRDAPPPPPPPSDGLPFKRLGATFSVREGLAVTRDFVLAGSTLSAKGDGWVSLDDERIDLNLTATVPDVGDVPVRISGALYDPKLDIDKSRIIGDTILNIFKGVINIPGSIINQFRRVF